MEARFPADDEEGDQRETKGKGERVNACEGRDGRRAWEGERRGR